jgi:signal peptidase I
MASENPRVIGAIDAKEFEARPPDAKYTVYYSARSMDQARKGTLDESDFSFGVAGKTIQIPPDYYFAMGDNRDNSADSRVWGFVHRDLIIGRAMFVYWSCDQSEGTGFLDCLTHPRLNRIGTLIK